MIKKEDLPDEDKKIWDEYTKSPSNIYDKEKKTPLAVREKNDLHLICMASLWMRQIKKLDI